MLDTQMEMWHIVKWVVSCCNMTMTPLTFSAHIAASARPGIKSVLLSAPVRLHFTNQSKGIVIMPFLLSHYEETDYYEKPIKIA